MATPLFISAIDSVCSLNGFNHSMAVFLHCINYNIKAKKQWKVKVHTKLVVFLCPFRLFMCGMLTKTRNVGLEI